MDEKEDIILDKEEEKGYTKVKGIWRVILPTENGKFKVLQEFKKECEGLKKARLKKNVFVMLFPEKWEVGMSIYQNGELYGKIVEIDNRHVIIDRSVSYPNKIPAQYQLSSFDEKFYRGLLEYKGEC